MKVNYELEMQKIINDLDGKPTVMLHSCCAPCSSSVIARLAAHFNIKLFFYNPNIEPYEEFSKRLEEQERFLSVFPSAKGIELVLGEYDNNEFRILAKGLEDAPEGGVRCMECIRLRMEKTAQMAKEYGCEFFTTTLSVSPHKNAQYINTVGKELEEKYGVKFLISDFKKKEGFLKSIKLSEEYNLYRQDYCGCLFSKGVNNG